MKPELDDRPEYQASRAIGATCGLITEVEFDAFERQFHRDRADAVYSTGVEHASIEDTIPVDFDDVPSLNICGKSTSMSTALVTTVGEFFDRYCLLWPIETWADGVLTGSAAGLGSEGYRLLDRQYLDVYEAASCEEAGYRQFSPDDEAVRWVPGTDLRTGEEVYVPSQVVSMAAPHRDERQPYYLSTTNGTATGGSLEFALVNAIYERVERDAMLYTWYTQTTPDRLSLDGLPRLERFRETLTDDFVDVELVELSTPTDVTVVGALLVDERDRVPKFIMSAAADLDPRAAVEDALVEAGQMRRVAKDFAAFGEYDPETDPASIYDLEDNVHYYMRPENFDAVRFLLEGPRRTAAEIDGDRPPSTGDELARCLEILEAADLTPIAFDVTTADASELGLRVARVVVPELLDLCLPGMPPVRHPRLADETTTDAGHPFG
jgi:thiazole/oxazole-forming peptide maturase SagD family component